MFALHGTQIQVVHSDDQHNEAEELAQDLMAINTVFICRQQGLRAAANRRSRKQQIEPESENDQTINDTEDESTSQ